MVTDPSLKDEVQVTVIATGFDRVVAERWPELLPTHLLRTANSVSEYSTSGNDKRRYRRINDDWMQD